MPIRINLDVMLAKRKMRLGELSERVGVSATNLSILKTARRRRCDSAHSRRSAQRLIASQATFWSTSPTTPNSHMGKLRRISMGMQAPRSATATAPFRDSAKDAKR